MPRPLRAEVFDPKEVCIVHCVQRCVRRAYLTGFDKESGKDYEYRREWIRERMEKLASVFGIDCLTYAILSNHLHIVLRSRPDVVKTWSDREVAVRWLQIFPGKRIEEQLGDPTAVDVDMLVHDQERLSEIRVRLSDISWYMRALSEPIARMANKEDQCTGSFWEGRFKPTCILDEASLLACCLYVDLNPIRAAMAHSVEQSNYTSAFDRIGGMKGKKIHSCAVSRNVISREEASKIAKNVTSQQRSQMRKEARNRKGTFVLRDAWLAPLTLAEHSKPGPHCNKLGQRPSDKGFLPMSREDYLALLDWTGRQGKPGKQGKVPEKLAPILQRLGIESTMWSELVWNFKRYFGKSSTAGKPDRMKEHASNHAKQFSPGQRMAKKCFS